MGVSFDTPEANQAWCTAEGFEFELWSDLQRVLALYYGAASTADQANPARKTVLLGADGKLMLEYLVTDVFAHPDQVLADCQALFGG